MPLKLKVALDHLEQPLSEEFRIIMATLLPSLWTGVYPALQMDEPSVASLSDYRQAASGTPARAQKAMEEMA